MVAGEPVPWRALLQEGPGTSRSPRLPPCLRIPLPTDVGSSRQPLSGEQAKSGAVLAEGSVPPPGLEEAGCGTCQGLWKLSCGSLEPFLQAVA